MGPKAIIRIDAEERRFLELFRLALSERTHEERMRAIKLVKQDVTSDRLDKLFNTGLFRTTAGPHDFEFVKWAAQTAYARQEAVLQLSEVDRRIQDGTQRKLRIAEHIGIMAFLSIRDEEFRGIQSPRGILQQVRDEAKDQEAHGARDKDGLRRTWGTYRGVVHLGMAISYLKDNPEQDLDVFEVSELFRTELCENCPRGTKTPYVPETEQIKFLFASRLSGPRFRDRGLPFFDR